MSAVKSSVLSAIEEGLSVRPYGDSELVRLPLAFADGHLLQVKATRMSEDFWHLSDRGLTAGALLDDGVDLTTEAGSRSWQSLLRSIELPPAMGHVDEYELATSSDNRTLGQAILRLAEAMMLGDGLRALKRQPRGKALGQRIISVATELHLGVVPRAPMRTRFGVSREVTVKVSGTEGRELFTQGVGKATGASYDHARALFADAAIPEGQRLTVVGNEATLEGWQWDALGTVSRTVREDDLATEFAKLVA